jgi:radical SAM protein
MTNMKPMINIPEMAGRNHNERPFLVIWEVTQSCDLACKHCRAAAQPLPHPDQLTNAQGKALIDQIADLEVPIFVMTGGDPLKRADVFELIRYASDKGVHTALTPSATPLLTREAIFKLKEAGLVRLGISLDGSTAEIHDNFRQLQGAYAKTIQAVEWANEAGIPIQVHTTVSRHNQNDLDNLADLMTALKIVMWNVFFLVPVGRGKTEDLLSGEEFEQVFAKMYELSGRVDFQIKTTEAMHYRRYLLQHNLMEKKAAGHPGGHPGHVGHPGALPVGIDTESIEISAKDAMHAKTIGWATRRVNDGKGFVFVSHTGNVYPSGFLPIHAGNVKEQHLGEIYREAPVFKALRDSSQLKGKCGACEYKEICGGSRARTYALTGDFLGEEVCCIYQPKGYVPTDKASAKLVETL